MQKKTSSKKGILRYVGFVVIILYACFMLVDMQINLADRSDELKHLETQLEIQRIENKDLERQIANETEEDAIERIAREQLDFVSPNEKVFEDISGS